jgi:hypothetical protein
MSQNYDQTVWIEMDRKAKGGAAGARTILGRPAAEAVWLRPENRK